ncbi:hypothetical protein B0H13DRAFT_1902265 [Mycena leptocephala]|nr:hypothetical protein B0H13DRAFT_1902265 [Mycena leptocephala]
MKMKISVGAYWAPVRLDNEESAGQSTWVLTSPVIFEVGRAPDFVSATTTGQTSCRPRLPDFVSATTPQLRRRLCVGPDSAAAKPIISTTCSVAGIGPLGLRDRDCLLGRIHGDMAPRIRGEDDGIRKRRRRGDSDSDNEQTPVAGPSSRQQASLAAPAARPIDDHRLKRIRGEAEGDIKPLVAPLPPAESASAVFSDPPPPSPPSPMDAAPIPEKFGPLEKKERVAPQGASKKINEARTHFATLQKAILSSFAHRDLGMACACGEKPEATLYRCQDCFKPRMCCRRCIISKHGDNPFHRLEIWTGKHFERVRWEDSENDEPRLVLQTCLKTGAERCPEVTDKAVRSQTVTLRLRILCVHAGRGAPVLPHWEQFLALGLFPASYSTPKTVFTWTVMKEFHIHCLTSKKSPYDYVKALCKLTDNAFAPDVTDRYREFLFAYRIWRYLALQRRTGQAHGIDHLIPHRRPGSLTVRCPACPEVGFNISPETMKAALESEQHKFRLYLSGDGNFKLQRKNKRDDPDDVALNAGNGYFVETEEYQRYLKLVKPTEDAGTCSHLRAARMQNISKFKNAVISGVVAVQCARHGFYLPQGMVDLKKGEALAEASLQRWILFTYDIWCQYSIKFKTRVAQWFPAMADIIELVRGAIPKMHIHNHIELCQLIWNLNWLIHSAFTAGEMIETGWVEHNLTAGSTKEQNDGNRHDSVDDTSGNHNWNKLVGLAAALLRLYRVCQVELRKRSTNFAVLNAKHPAELIKKWENTPMTPTVFQVNFKNGERSRHTTWRQLTTPIPGPPTHAEAYAKLLRAEAESEATSAAVGEQKTGDSGLISSGMLVERDQHHVKRMIATHAGDELVAAARRRLYESVTDLRSRLVARAPALEKHILDADPERPEKEALFLPSHFTAPVRSEMKLAALGQVEYTLREGQAFDALCDVRTAIRTLNYNLAFKKTQIHGVGPNTKGQNFLKTLSNDIQVGADTYRRARRALLALGLHENDPSLRELLRADLFGKGGRRTTMGDSKTHEPWIWTTGRAANLSEAEEAEWEAELDRVKWFQDRALRDRAVEEAETLEEEFGRATTWFSASSDVWTVLGDEEPEAGAKAYAYKQATMYKKLGEKVSAAWASAPEWVAKDKKKEEEKEEKERVQAERRMAEYREKHGDDDDFSAYYETIEIYSPSV